MQASADSDLNKDTEKILLGHVSGLFGVKGWVKIFSYTQPRAQITSYAHWYLGEKLTPVKVEAGHAHKEGVVAKIVGVDDRDSAAELKDLDIWVDKSALADLPPGEFYWHQLIGLTVVDLQGKELGRITDLLETGANDVLILQSSNNTECLIPYVKDQVIKLVDLSEQRMVVDWDVNY